MESGMWCHGTQYSPMKNILDFSARLFGVLPEVILSDKRDAPVCIARNATMYVMAKKYGYSQNWIANFFNRDHSTVCYAIHKIEVMLNRGLEADKQRLRNNIERMGDSTKVSGSITPERRELEEIIGEAKRILAELREERQSFEDGQKVRSLRKIPQRRTLERRQSLHYNLRKSR